jgi:hypothetical protein
MAALESVPRGWRAHELRPLVYSLLGFLIAWGYKERVLWWMTEPLIETWQSNPCSQRAVVGFPYRSSLTPTYLYIAAMGALLVAVPFIGRMMVTRLASRAGARAKSSPICFVLASFLAMAVVVATARPILLPAVSEYTLPSLVWCSQKGMVYSTDVIIEYVENAFFAMASAAFGLELCVVVFELWRRGRTSKAGSSPE